MTDGLAGRVSHPAHLYEPDGIEQAGQQAETELSREISSLGEYLDGVSDVPIQLDHYNTPADQPPEIGVPPNI
jgi:hypothetical protein